MINNFKVVGHWLTFQVRSMTENSENRDLLEHRKMMMLWGFGVLITNFMLVLPTDDVPVGVQVFIGVTATDSFVTC